MIEFTEDEHDELMHIGIIRRSGRYPWGSGKNPMQRSNDFQNFMNEMTAKGFTQTQIAEYLTAYAGDGRKVTTNDLRAGTAISTEMIRSQNISTAVKLKETAMSTRAIGEEMGVNESTVRGWLKSYETNKQSSLRATAEALKEQQSKKPFLDVGKGQELYLGIADTKLRTTLAVLKEEGYEVHSIKIPQLGTKDQFTNTKVLCAPGTKWNDARLAVLNGQLQTLTAQSDDGGMSFRIPKEMPVSISSKRVKVRYGDEGGDTMDGIIELRRGVPELDLGSDRYGQVRIAVDGTHYLKGMAMHADDLPAGVDVRFNTPKANTGNKLDAMKPMKMTPEGDIDLVSPFGSNTVARPYADKNGKTQTSALNLVGKEGKENVEGRWDQWSNALSSQMLSKQPIALASKQLAAARNMKQKELDDIMAMTNPVVRKRMLDDFAESADAAAVHLKAAKIPDQSNHVILPMNSMRPTEVYAPNFPTGTRVALVRHPHGGPFEIPDLIVNNNNATARKILGGAKDAIGIHHTVAEQLSGADFDGDTVLVIPNNNKAIKTRPPLEGLKDFNAKDQYRIPDDDTTTPRMTKRGTQTEMGKISNLISDMSIHQASDEDMVKAIRHSMVVIDAEKHGLNYKASEADNSIKALKDKYQASANGSAGRGASTLISRASSEAKIEQVALRKAKDGGPIDPKTGALIYEPTGATRTKTTTTTSKRTGETTTKTTEEPLYTYGTKMEFTPDARTLLSGTGKLEDRGQPIERVYAAHANAMKSLANMARKESYHTTMPKASDVAKKTYSNEVDSLNAKLKIALRNAPLERRAQSIGNGLVRARIESDPSLDREAIKKYKGQALEDARRTTGASKTRVYISDREWEAIQARAVAPSKLAEILTHSVPDRVKELATPRARTALTPGQLARARQMAAQNKTPTEIADALGLPRSTVADNLAAG